MRNFFDGEKYRTAYKSRAFSRLFYRMKNERSKYGSLFSHKGGGGLLVFCKGGLGTAPLEPRFATLILFKKAWGLRLRPRVADKYFETFRCELDVSPGLGLEP